MPERVIITEASALIISVDSRRVTADVIPGQLWGQGERAALGIS
ncbi:MAG: hypothetical protein OIN90_11860 [Candidatus Methanoperedens sp.]|nr:hypothetical protein [Candidatus Methanoperedens sp.]MCX9088243.1 hypothetical protein [Candidatus Methanoperedens sp.]